MVQERSKINSDFLSRRVRSHVQALAYTNSVSAVLFYLTFLLRLPLSNGLVRKRWTRFASQLETNNWQGNQTSLEEQEFPDLPSHKLSFVEGFNTLKCVQACAPLERSIRIGGGGGFGSMFQFAAKDFLDAQVLASRHEKAIRVRFKGDFKWYTKNSGCGRTGFRCFFKAETVSSSVNNFCNRATCSLSKLPFASNAFWWGVFQAYMFRPNAVLLGAADELRKKFNFEGFPDIALHIRMGDKKDDPKSRQNIEISPREYLKLARHWSEVIVNSTGRKALLFVATDSIKVQKFINEWAHLNLNTTHVIMQTSELALKGKKYRAKSNEAAKVGMHISSKDKFSEAQKFILDLHFMMHARYFGGLCMSQPARIVVNIGYLKGTLRQAVALDDQNIELVDRWKFGRSEGWSKISDIL